MYSSKRITTIAASAKGYRVGNGPLSITLAPACYTTDMPDSAHMGGTNRFGIRRITVHRALNSLDVSLDD